MPSQDESTEALLEQGGPEEADGDDLVSSMSAEAYLEMRVLGELPPQVQLFCV